MYQIEVASWDSTGGLAGEKKSNLSEAALLEMIGYLLAEKEDLITFTVARQTSSVPISTNPN